MAAPPFSGPAAPPFSRREPPMPPFAAAPPRGPVGMQGPGPAPSGRMQHFPVPPPSAAGLGPQVPPTGPQMHGHGFHPFGHPQPYSQAWLGAAGSQHQLPDFGAPGAPAADAKVEQPSQLSVYGAGGKSPLAKRRLQPPLWYYIRSVWDDLRSVTVLLGVVMMSLLVLIPIYNSVTLMHDPMYTYLLGTDIPKMILTACVFVVVVLFITMTSFFVCAPMKAQTIMQTTVIIMCFLTMLGFIFIIFSAPLTRQANEMYAELWHNCPFGKHTRDIFAASQGLYAMRAQQDCASLSSVEECPEYEAFPNKMEAQLIKFMENDYACSGFCYHTPGTRLAEGEGPAQQIRASPPTLFSSADYSASCEGMAARRMRDFVGAIGQQTFWEGIALVVSAILTTLLMLMAFCSSVATDADEEEFLGIKKKADYGAVA